MDRNFPIFTPLGRLYDPLLLLAERVYHALAGKEKTVWTDANGYVFATPTALVGSIRQHATIGIYGKGTPISVIEAALRLALRERANGWIVDWQSQLLGKPHRNVGILRRMPPRRRRRKPEDLSVVASGVPTLLPGADLPEM
jgi:hypothetical protein